MTALAALKLDDRVITRSRAEAGHPSGNRLELLRMPQPGHPGSGSRTLLPAVRLVAIGVGDAEPEGFLVLAAVLPEILGAGQ
jgi:hypothetical protein